MYYDRSKSCTPYNPSSSESQGHWEKTERKVDRYFYVDGMEPSTLPNAVVVSSDEA